MTANDRAKAEKHLDAAARHLTEEPQDMRIAEVAAAIGQGYALLAAGEAATADAASTRHAISTYRFALIRQVAEGLALSKGDEAHQHARGLAQYLDSVGLNVDDAVEAYIEEHCGFSDPRDAWLPPTERRAKWAAELEIPF
ncbi:hypothetical protein [Streptomyces sp. NPDC056056]|uniref:hypothetical protein n=1 Tax=Streptomyces sp. NPDC056056 TaxID=3345698 RepID=UPI0035E0AC9F